MSAPNPLSVGAVLFPGFELLDIYGPLEMFGLLEPRAGITMLAQAPGRIESSCGVAGFADAAMSQAAGFDVLLLPGGIGTRREAGSAPFLAELRRLAEASGTVGTICTGGYLLARTGLLDGRRATTNKRVFDLLTPLVPAVRWVREARWVEDGKYFTSSGVSAGMDMALALIAHLLGHPTALEVAKRAEYTWQQDRERDPFAEGMSGK